MSWSATPPSRRENLSIPPDAPLNTDSEGKIEQVINGRLSYCTAVLVVGGRFTRDRPWIQHEIDKTQPWNEPLVVVRQRKPTDIPRELREVTTRIVRWEGPEIIAVLRELRRRTR